MLTFLHEDMLVQEQVNQFLLLPIKPPFFEPIEA